MDLVAQATKLARRGGVEALSGLTLLQSGMVRTVDPRAAFGMLRALVDYGPAGAATAVATLQHGARTAIVDDFGELTYAELDRRATALAAALHERGLRSGDGLGLLCRNHRGFAEAMFAGAKLGARTLLLNTDFSATQLADVCEREDVLALVHDAEFAEVASRVEPDLGRIVAATDGASGAETTIEDLVRLAGDARPPVPTRKQQLVLLTSGTTGTPKGASRHLGLSLAIPGGYLSKIPMRAGRTTLVSAPMFHAWGLLGSTIAFALGNTLVLRRRFDPEQVLTDLETHRCDAMVTVPILLSRLIAKAGDRVGEHDLAALRIVAMSGSALPPGLAAKATELFGPVLYNLYGSTEVAYATIATPADLAAAPGTVGRPPVGVRVRIVDEHGAAVPRGETGRIVVGTGLEFSGYTGGGSKDVVDGLMATGDVGHLDAAGRLFVDGRDDDMIVSGGENVFPAEIEDLLHGHPGIADAAVVGVPDEQFGQRLNAYVVRSDDALDEDAVLDYVKQHTARFKVPREVVFLDALPRNPAGKVVKRDLPS